MKEGERRIFQAKKKKMNRSCSVGNKNNTSASVECHSFTGENEVSSPSPKHKVWTEVVGGPKKGPLRGLGSQGSFRARFSSSTSGVDMQNWQNEKRELLNRVLSYETENTELRQRMTCLETQLSEHQAKQQEDIEFLKAQFLMLQQQQQQLGGSSYYLPPARPPNSGHNYSSYNRSRLSKFMPTTGGSSFSHDAPPLDSPYEDLANDDDGEQNVDY